MSVSLAGIALQSLHDEQAKVDTAMKFETPAGRNPIDALNVVGKPVDRVAPTDPRGMLGHAGDR
ncbi:MAG: hypothetical protein EOO38_18895, partial [Cytophagaceae bacterium]